MIKTLGLFKLPFFNPSFTKDLSIQFNTSKPIQPYPNLQHAHLKYLNHLKSNRRSNKRDPRQKVSNHKQIQQIKDQRINTTKNSQTTIQTIRTNLSSNDYPVPASQTPFTKESTEYQE